MTEQGSQSIESLYDFVYLDRDRLAAFSAQIFDNGTLVGLKVEDKVQNQVTSEMSSGLKPVFTAAEKENLTNIRGIEKQFDAGWALPLNVLNKLDELGLIKRSLADADFGELVLFSGSINLIDLGIMRELWEPIAAMEAFNNQPKTKTTAKLREAQKEREGSKHIASIMKHLPHSIQLRIFNDHEQAWSSLRREFLTINSEDFILKHGASIQGKWHCLAILDGKPYVEDEGLNIPDGANDLEFAMWQMSMQLRLLLGRSGAAYGLTPISIFRSVQ